MDAPPAHEGHGEMTGPLGSGALVGIDRGDAAQPEGADPQEVGRHRHRVGGELAAARPRARARPVFHLAEVGVRHAPRRMRADGFEHVLDGDVASREPPGRNGPAVQNEPGDVQPGERHRGTRDRLVAPDEDHEGVEQVAARHELNRVGDHFAADERRSHPGRSHRDAVGNRDRVEFHRRAARRADACLHRHREVAQVEIAWTDLDPGVRHADDGLLEVVAREP